MKKLLKQALFIVAGITMIGSATTALADDTLESGERLYSYYNDSLSSNNGQFRLVMQNDGNLVLYCNANVYGCGANEVLWSTGTAGQDVEFCVMQSDGNLVLYHPDGQAVWDSKTNGNPGAYLTLQDNGNMVIYVPKALWATNTGIANGIQPIPAPENPPYKGCNPPPHCKNCVVPLYCIK